MADLATTRRLWTAAETIHAVSYFAPEAESAARHLGLKGFWGRYFAMRSAPFGAVGPAVTTATFFNFHPAMVARAIPGVWEKTTPAAALQARANGARAALRRVLPVDVDPSAAVALVREAMAATPPDGRALYAANLTVAWPDTSLADLWHATTLIREHRGDGHNAALVAHGIDGCQAHVLTAAAGGAPRTETQPYRGWADEDWDAAAAGLRDRGFIDGSERATDTGLALKADIEEATDRAAGAPWDHLGPEQSAAVLDALEPLARAITAAGVLRYPNPIGLAPVT